MTLDCVHCGRAVTLPDNPRDGDEVPCACGGKNRVTCDGENPVDFAPCEAVDCGFCDPMSDGGRVWHILNAIELSRNTRATAPDEDTLRRLLTRLWEHP